MIFHVALDAEGKHHLATTQAEAGKVNRNFETIEIPTDKSGLRDFVQGLLDQIDVLTGQANSLKHDASIAPVTITEAPTASMAEMLAHPASAHIDLPLPSRKQDPVIIPITHLSIMEWLLDTATQAQVEQVFSAIGARWGEAR